MGIGLGGGGEGGTLISKSKLVRGVLLCCTLTNRTSLTEVCFYESDLVFGWGVASEK